MTSSRRKKDSRFLQDSKESFQYLTSVAEAMKNTRVISRRVFGRTKMLIRGFFLLKVRGSRNQWNENMIFQSKKLMGNVAMYNLVWTHIIVKYVGKSSLRSR